MSAGPRRTGTNWRRVADVLAERERGIVHTPEWGAKMADLQRDWYELPDSLRGVSRRDR